MILLQTLTRVHICFTLLASQVLGSIATIVARACAPNKIGPGPISPDVTAGASSVANAWFWIALFFQLLIWLVIQIYTDPTINKKVTDKALAPDS
jgi:alpha-1,3-glucan synthase